MQVYRGLDIGTAKPAKPELESVPHHLIDVVEPTEKFDAATFVEKGKEAEKKVKNPIFCGGTGMYFRAWLEGLGESAPAQMKKREQNLREWKQTNCWTRSESKTPPHTK